MKLHKFILSILLFFLFMDGGTASALMVDLEVPHKADMPVMIYGTVVGYVDAVDNTIFHFEIDLAPDLSADLNGGNNFGMDKFLFNTRLDLTEDMFINFDPIAWAISYNRNIAGFGRFDLKLNGRGQRTNHLSFDIDYTSPVTEDDFFLLSDGNAPAGPGHFGAHIGGFDYDVTETCNVNSFHVRDRTTDVVPEPTSILLIGSGLFGIVALRRKKK